MRKILFLLFLLISQQTFAQFQGNVWCFSDSNRIVFNPNPVVDVMGSICEASENAASIAGSNGQLLFYVSSPQQLSTFASIRDNNNFIIGNGDSLICSGSSTNGSVIIPFPNDSTRFYVFTQSEYPTPNNGFWQIFYSIIEPDTLNGHVITPKNNVLSTDTMAEKIAVVKHGNGRDYWICTHRIPGNSFFLYLVNPNGINLHSIHSIGQSYTILSGLHGEMIFSETGEKLLSVGYGLIDLFDFDRCKGVISNYNDLVMGPRFICPNFFMDVLFLLAVINYM